MLELKNRDDFVKAVEQKVVESLGKVEYGEIHIIVTMHNGLPVKLGTTVKENISSSAWDKVVIHK